MRAIAPVIAAVLAAASLLIAGCGPSASSLPEGATAAPVGSDCDAATFEETVHHLLMDSGMTLATLGEFTCSGDWAFVRAELSTDGGAPAPDQFIFKRSEGDWILKAAETVCGTPGSAGAERPGDAEIPADLWAQACPGN